MGDVEKGAKSMVEKFLGDVSKTSATKQIILGASSGWVTGFLAIRVGKTVALALGGGIILLQVANEKGYIKINWNKLNKKIDKITDKVEEKINGEERRWVDKAEKYVDRKLNQVENTLKKNQKKVKKWYTGFLGEDYRLRELHVFALSFVAGAAIGIGTA